MSICMIALVIVLVIYCGLTIVQYQDAITSAFRNDTVSGNWVTHGAQFMLYSAAVIPVLGAIEDMRRREGGGGPVRPGGLPATSAEKDPFATCRLEADEALHAAWDALTPGRQRSHILHVSGAKQADTRDRRAERCAADILEGRGFNER